VETSMRQVSTATDGPEDPRPQDTGSDFMDPREPDPDMDLLHGCGLA
jgi:hypothetical protein